MKIFPWVTLIGIGGAVGSWFFVGIFRHLALKKGMLDYPNERSSHTKATPRGGGIGIVVVNLIGGIFLLSNIRFSPAVPYFSFSQMALVMSGALLVVMISWMDDVRHGLAPTLRLGVHIVAAGLVIIAIGGWNHVEFPYMETVELSWLGIFLALLWIVGLVNVYNFMDGIDGIAGVQTITAAGGWVAVGILSNNSFLSVFGVLIGASAIGFLVHNWPPATIFMGDVGSAFLGFVLAVLPLLAGRMFSEKNPERLPVAGVLMVAPFILDATFTLLRRISRKEKISQAHRSHLYQRLVLTGLSHRTVTLLYLSLGLIGSTAGVGYIFLLDPELRAILTIGAIVVILFIPLFWVTKRERIRADHSVG